MKIIRRKGEQVAIKGKNRKNCNENRKRFLLVYVEVLKFCFIVFNNSQFVFLNFTYVQD